VSWFILLSTRARDSVAAIRLCEGDSALCCRMNFADEAIKTMSEAFDEATIDPREAVEKFVDEFEEGEVVSRRDEAERKRELRMAEAELTIARLRLAAFLPRLAELMERVWIPLRKQIAKAGLSPRNVMDRSD
jgi:transposase-like protein